VSIADGKLSVNGQHIAVYSERDPKNIPWGAAGESKARDPFYENPFWPKRHRTKSYLNKA
jgi:hypothetical protein